MSAEDIVKSFIPLVDFLADACGPLTEVVLHDLRNKEHSIVAIRNSHISGRDGDESLSDLARQLVHIGEHKGKHYITNYFSKAGKSGKTVRSSTYFIRDSEKNLIGMLGINVDLTAISEAQQVLDALMSVGSDGPSGNGNGAKGEAADMSLDEMVRSVVEQVIDNSGIEPARMTMEEKKSVVEELNAKGVFLLKGTVGDVAQRLDVSEQTIYRYLKNI